MAFDGLLLMVRTPGHTYIVRREQILELRLVTSVADVEREDERGKPVIGSDLGLLLNPQDESSATRRHALIVPTRRRSVGLLVDRIDDVYTNGSASQHHQVQKLPALLARQLARPWFMGVLIYEDAPVLVLDLRQIAQDALIQKSDENKRRAQAAAQDGA
jgi:hypothetical protein